MREKVSGPLTWQRDETSGKNRVEEKVSFGAAANWNNDGRHIISPSLSISRWKSSATESLLAGLIDDDIGATLQVPPCCDAVC